MTYAAYLKSRNLGHILYIRDRTGASMRRLTWVTYAKLYPYEAAEATMRWRHQARRMTR